ncbi:MAG: energy-coupling factor ABC transporter ATP-binding protein [Candidatus Anstonellales archaeon]
MENDDRILVQNFSVSYANGRHALSRINLKIKKGEIVAILGANGSGKSTLLYALNGIIPHLIKADVSGSVLVDGEKPKTPSKMAEKVGILFQNPDDQIFTQKVFDELVFGMRNLKKYNEKKAEKLLKESGFSEFRDADPFDLSHGQRQKLCFYSLVAMDPEIFLMDEPSSSLDYPSSLEIYSVIRKLAKTGKTFIIVEHDVDLMLEIAHRFAVLKKGKIIAQGKKQIFKLPKVKNAGIKIPREVG